MGRKRGPRGSASNYGIPLTFGTLVTASLVVRLVEEQTLAAPLLVMAGAVGSSAVAWMPVRRARRIAEKQRAVAVTDAMSGSEVEHWVARLMRSIGCRRVQVVGGAGDMGADVTGYAPDGRRLVVQCKRASAKVGSQDVQRFAGTARQIHRDDVPLPVTTNYLTAQAGTVASKCPISVVDRDALTSWIASLALPIPAAPPPASPPRLVLKLRLRMRPSVASTPVRPLLATPPPSPSPARPAGTASSANAAVEWWKETP